MIKPRGPRGWRRRAGSASRDTTSLRIGLWGAALSGKTTYLAALKLATDWDPDRRWLVSSPDDRGADAALNEWANDLVDERRFPGATFLATRDLSWRFLQTGWRSKPWWDASARRKRNYIDFLLSLQDVPGMLYYANPERETESEEVLATLSECDGLLFMFDPVRELGALARRARPEADGNRPDASTGVATAELSERGYAFFQRALDRMAETAMGDGTLFDRALPQFVAVCTTKLDEPLVFEFARSGGWLTTDPADPLRRPVVEAALPAKRSLEGASGDSRELFEAIADNRMSKRISGSFHKDRLAYFTTSSLGFFVDEDTGRFAPFDYHNATLEGEEDRVRGAVRPLNVLEPLLWLERAIRSRPEPEPVADSHERSAEGDAAPD